jgi:hypothetical protein
MDAIPVTEPIKTPDPATAIPVVVRIRFVGERRVTGPSRVLVAGASATIGADAWTPAGSGAATTGTGSFLGHYGFHGRQNVSVTVTEGLGAFSSWKSVAVSDPWTV